MSPPRDAADLAALAARLRAELGQDGVTDLIRMLRAAPPQPNRKTAPAAFTDRAVAALAPILARAEEKAGLVVDALASAGHPVSGVAIRGLKPTLARLVALVGEDAVWAGVEQVLVQARAFGALRETVV